MSGIAALIPQRFALENKSAIGTFDSAQGDDLRSLHQNHSVGIGWYPQTC
jgi:hypothetical protein